MAIAYFLSLPKKRLASETLSLSCLQSSVIIKLSVYFEMSKKCAVIMSLYLNDNIDFVSQAVESILNQSFTDFDYYIQYDGHVKDGIDLYLSSLSDTRIHISKRNENRGLAKSLNELLAVVTSLDYQFIARMDADDISTSDRFEKQVNYLQNHPEIDVVGGAINEIDENGMNRGKVTSYPCTADECRAFFAKRANIPDVVLNFRMTDDMFKNRRNGKAFAKSQLELRLQIKKDLGYGFMAVVYAYAMYWLMISPSWLLKLAYKVLR